MDNNRIRLGIMGFGHIGRYVYSLASEKQNFVVNTISDIGSPDITVSADTLDFIPTYFSLSSTASFTITNDGAEVLSISNISADHAYFTVETNSQSLQVDSSFTVTVIFAPETADSLSQTLTITSDDPDEGEYPIILSAIALDRADISVIPDTLNIIYIVNEALTDSLLLINMGGIASADTVSLGLVNGIPPPYG